jgi:hypothetical protein
MTVPRRIRTSAQRIPFRADCDKNLFWEEWVRNHRLFAAGLAAALMLGMASPALATPGSHGKGKALAKGHGKSKPNKPNPHKPAAPSTKGKKGGVSGGGSIAGGEFSIQALLRSKSKGAHFNYTSTDGKLKVHCKRDFTAFVPTFTGSEGAASVTFTNCQVTGQSAKVSVTVDVKDRANNDAKAPTTATPAVADFMGFSYSVPAAAGALPTTATVGGDMTSGNIKVRK